MSRHEHSNPTASGLDSATERRMGDDRRRLTFRTFIQGGFTPRRRGGRRADEHEHLVDWHEPDLLFVAIMIVLLSVTDAFLTLTLLMNGAEEANPVLAYVLDRFPTYFALLKMVLTGVGVLILVALARARVFRIMRVRTVLQCFLAGYMFVVGYEVWLLRVAL